MVRISLYVRKVLVAFVILLMLGSLAQGQDQISLSPSQIKHEAKTRSTPPPTEDTSVTLGGASAAASAQSKSWSDDEFSNVQVSKNQNSTDCVRTGASETTIAGDEDKLVVGFNDGEGFAGPPFFRGSCLTVQAGLSGFAFSNDGGRTFTDGGAPPIGSVIALGPGPQGCSSTGRYVTRGDPWLDFDGEETFVYANLAQWDDNAELATSRCFVTAAGQNLVPTAGISVHFGSFRSEGKSETFAWTNSVLLQSPNYPRDFLDKESIAVDRDSKGTNIFIATTNFIEVCNIPFFGFGQMELYRSLDSGVTWSRTIIEPDETFITNPANPDCGLDGVENQGPAVAVGTSGQVFVTYERGWFAPLIGGAALPRATIAFRMSTNQGASFGPRRTVKSICSGAVLPPRGYNRTINNDFPRIAVAAEGKFKGRIFIAFQDCSAANGAAAFGRDTDIHLAFSDDEGQTWTIVPVGPQNDGKIQFWPNVTVSEDGEVNVVYYESQEVNVTPDPNDFECVVRTGGPLTNPTLRRSKLSSLVDVFLARSKDGGQTFGSPMRVTTQTTNWCKATPLNSIIPNFGDYITSRSADSETVITWADGRNGGRVDHIPTVFFSRGER